MLRTPTSALAVIGLGLMGSRMSRRLLDDGFRLRGFDPEDRRRGQLQNLGGEVAASPAEAVQECWGAMLSLPDSDISREVCLGKGGIAESGVTPLVVFDTTTGRPGDAVAIAASLADVGITYSDATLSGNSAMAERGELVVMVGGPADAYGLGIPVFESIGRSHHHVGDTGAGCRMKLLVNHILTIHRLALAEGLVTAELAGMDLETTLDVLIDSLAYSKAMDTWGGRMIAGDHAGPSSRLRQGYKDARLIVEQGQSLCAPTALVEVARDTLAEGEASGLADLDNSSVIEVLRRRAGIGRIQE